MRGVFAVVLMVIFSGLFVSCGISVGFAQSHGGTNLNYQVPVKEARFVGEVSAKVKGHSVLCVFPTYDPLMEQAAKKLNETAKLKKGGRAVFNLRTDVEDKFYVLWCTRHVTVSGDVYEIIDKEKYERARTLEEKKRETERQKMAELKKQKEEAERAQRVKEQDKKRQQHIQEQKEKGIQQIKELEKMGLNGFEDIRQYFAKYWDALKNKDLVMIKNNIDSLMNQPEILKQEGYYFLGDAALLEENIREAKNQYIKGLSMGGTYQKGFKYHLKQLGVLHPELQPLIKSIYSDVIEEEMDN